MNGVTGLFDQDPQGVCRLPGHDVGGGGAGDGMGRQYGPWTEGSSMSTRQELPDLSEGASPLQFGDWLHLAGPLMKDVSSCAAWWWESTLREARCYYEQWKSSTPLGRIQIRPRLPEALSEARFQRTEQRGVQMLLKAIPLTEQQELVTDRALSSTAILYKLLIRFQPGGAGEKQILLQQLLTIPKTTTIKDLAAALRNWRRHFGRAQEVDATLPDGVLLLKALDSPSQQLGALDPQAAFRLAQSRMQLGLDTMPTQQALWSYSQCLLAEAETLVLLQTGSLTLTPQTPLKLKQMQGDPKTPPKAITGEVNKTPMSEKLCKYFLSDAGCRAGKSCKWLHSLEAVPDRAQRCWICGGKDHRKQDCKLRAGKSTGEPSGSGGGNGQGRGGGATSTTNATSSTGVGGKAGAAAKVIKAPLQDDQQMVQVEEKVDGTSSTTTAKDVKSSGGEAEVNAVKSDKTAELLHEATQLLKTLRVPTGNPRLKVMQIGGLDQADEGMMLLDSGATHGLRPARDQGEWDAAEPTQVQLANGTTDEFRLKKGTKILLVHPTARAAWIMPMGGLTALDFKLEWTEGGCRLYDDENRNIPVTVINGCPMISMDDGRKLMEWLEFYYVHQWRKLAMVRTMLADDAMVDRSKLTMELAFTLKLRQVFPDLPDELMMRVVPPLELLKGQDFEASLPWNRHKRRRLRKAKNVVIHVFSGPGESFWNKQCSTATTEVLCVDLLCGTPASLMDRHVYAYVLTLCASGRVRSILGGPPCRTVSSLRYQQDGGPGVLRTDDYPYGKPDLQPSDLELVHNDATLMLRFWSLQVLAEEVRDVEQCPTPTQFIMEQPEDPARYRSEQDVAEHGYFSVFRTMEWRQFAAKYGMEQIHFDQFPMGHPKRKPTTLGTNDRELHQLHEMRGGPSDEAESSARLRALPLQQRCEASKSWASWAPGLKAAIAEAVNHHVQRTESAPSQHQSPALRPLTQVALESWKNHFLNDHLPARRDCAHCVRAQARSRPHRKVRHPEAYTLSVDLSGKMTAGSDQENQRARYLLVACYTFPVHRNGRPLIEPPGSPATDQDHPLPAMDLRGGGDPSSGSKDDQPLPSMDLHGGEGRSSDVGQPLPSMDLHGGGDHSPNDPGLQDGVWDENDVLMDDGGDLPPQPESPADLADPLDPLGEEAQLPVGPDGPREEALRGAYNVWHKLVDEATDVAIKNLTFVELVNSRSVQEVLPAIARIHARLQALGLPLMRIHCDRARELVAAPIRKWTLDRGIITTLTSGSSFKSNGRVESEVGNVKRAIKTILSANMCPMDHWPLCARHIGERRLRSQLQSVGFPTAPMLRFGCKAYALRKSWQERYTNWRDAREEVVIMGPDKFTSLTTSSYYVRSVATGRFFYTDDVVQLPPDVPHEMPGDQPAIYVEERDDRPMMPQWSGVPTRRLRGKTAAPAIRSMLHIEGEDRELQGHDLFSGPRFPSDVFEIPTYLKSYVDMDELGSTGESSWTLDTDSQQTTASPTADTPTMQSDVAESGGGEREEAPNNRDGGSSPVASSLCGVAAIRAMHANVVNYIRDEMGRLDATTEDQALWIKTITEAISLRTLLEDQLQGIQQQALKKDQENLNQEFLVTKTIGNAEVWADLDAWAPSIQQEYDQLVTKKCAVRQLTKDQLRAMASEMKLPIEILPGKMVHTRKAGSGAFRSRAVVCGNYATPDQSEHYAGGVDSQQVRTQLRLGASKQWMVGCTDIRTAFLNAPRRDSQKLVAMEIPVVFRKLGLATNQHIWLIDKALYGLTTSPRDWSLHRDETIPSFKWQRQRLGRKVHGAFQKTPDENVWRMVEVEDETGDTHWTGLMSVYVDDLLFTSEEGAMDSAVSAIEKVWAIAEVEKTGEGRVVKYCGFEIENALDDQGENNGFVVSQKKYEKEMVQRFGIEKSIDFPNIRLTEEDEIQQENIDANDVKMAQSMAGALLWLSTRTRPDLAMTVSAACRLCTKNPRRSIEIATTIMQYVKGMSGGLHYTKDVPTDQWGTRGQLKMARHQGLLEVYADIAYGTGTKNRSVQGIAVYLGGCIIAWQTTVQPFVTHSTAESELVSYGDALNAGRSIEAMLANMLGEPIGSDAIERVIYGDNVAAIGIAHGTSCTSWRTRHLKIRASYLREALDGIAPGGAWKLLHLKGTELVADGLTKPLLGQAFNAFLADLGMKRSERAEPHPEGAGDQRGVAIATLMAGGLLLSGVDAAAEEEGEATSNALWACGAILMALGTIYVGKLAHDGVKCCLRRLKATELGDDVGSSWILCDASESEEEGSSSMPSRSGSHSKRGATLKSLTSQSGLRGERSTSSSGPMPLNITSSSGLQHGEHSPSGACVASRPMPSQSGSRKRGAAAESSAAGSMSGPNTAVASLAGERSESSMFSGGEDNSVPVPKVNPPQNPWNRFQKDHKGKGLSKKTMSQIYQYEKSKRS